MMKLETKTENLEGKTIKCVGEDCGNFVIVLALHKKPLFSPTFCAGQNLFVQRGGSCAKPANIALSDVG